MPRWRPSARVFAAWSRRHSLNAPSQEILTGILPVAEVDRHYTDDRIDLWGMFTQQAGTATANRLGSCSLLAQEKELLVHKIELQLVANFSVLHSFHLFTPLQTYAPSALNATLVLPWMQPVQPGEPGRLSRAIGVCGETDAGLMTVTVNGAPHTAIGPSFRLSTFLVGTIGTFEAPQVTPAWGFQDPPLRVKPFQQLTVQATTQLAVNVFLGVNWYWTERDAQGDVG